MKQLLLKWLKKTAIRELKDAFDRNLTPTEENTLYELMTRVEIKAKDGCGKEIAKIIKSALN